MRGARRGAARPGEQQPGHVLSLVLAVFGRLVGGLPPPGFPARTQASHRPVPRLPPPCSRRGHHLRHLRPSAHGQIRMPPGELDGWMVMNGNTRVKTE